MKSEDDNALCSLVEEYSPVDLIDGLYSAFEKKADSLCDLGLNEQSKECSKILFKLNEITSSLKR